VLNGLLLTCWSILTPIYHAPDEPTHADAVMRLVEGDGWARVGHAFLTREGDAATDASPYGTPAKPRLLSPAPILQKDALPRYDRPSWATVDVGGRPYKHKTLQQMVQHPPGYYYVEAAAVKVFGGDSQRWDRAVGIMRLTSVLMIMPLPLLAWAFVARLLADARAAVTAASVTLVVPEVSHIGGVVNNDNALTLTGGLVLVGLACVLRGDRSRRTAVFVGVCLGLALFSKGLALVLVPFVPACYLTAWLYRRHAAAQQAQQAQEPPELLEATGAPEDAPAPEPESSPSAGGFRTVLVPVVLAGVLALAIGGWWYVVNVLRYGAIQPKVPGFPPGEFLGDDPGRMFSLSTASMLQRWWGSIGWYEVQMPFRYVYAAALVLVVFLALAVVRARSGTRPAILLALGPTVTSYALVVAGSVSYYLRTHYYTGLSGRYLFVGFVGVAAVAGIGVTRVGVLRRPGPLLVLLGGAVMQYKAIWLAIFVWWRPRGGSLTQAWDALLAWSPWSPTIVKGVILLTLVASLVVVGGLIRLAFRDDPSDHDTSTRPVRAGRGERSRLVGARPETRSASAA
jgi:small subunit ribosomal protein S36